ncbi:MAG: T9SS type A sorting domain-containing protein [Taibaiella sp.]|jgi:hypothetical protein
MKRIYTTVALLGALVTGAFAQRQANISGVLIVPAEGSTMTLTCTDSFKLTYVYLNLGPDKIFPTDTIAFNDGRTNPYTSAFQVTGDTVNVNDTIFGVDTYIGRAELEFLWDATSGAVDTTQPFNGSGHLFPVLSRGFGWAVTSTAVEDPTGDDDQLQIPLTINCNLGIDVKGLAKQSLLIYPNPASTELRFKYSFTNGLATARIMDIAGRTILAKDFGKMTEGEKELTLDVSSLNNGIYYIELVNGENRAINKVTIQK